MITTSPIIFARKAGQRHRPSALHRCWRMQRQCRRSAHNVLLLGSPGAGTSMLARGLATILAAMTRTEAIKTTRVHRVAGLTGDCLPPVDRAGVASIQAAPVDRQRVTTPRGETCPLP
jgi:predicted ATPase